MSEVRGLLGLLMVPVGGGPTMTPLLGEITSTITVDGDVLRAQNKGTAGVAWAGQSLSTGQFRVETSGHIQDPLDPALDVVEAAAFGQTEITGMQFIEPTGLNTYTFDCWIRPYAKTWAADDFSQVAFTSLGNGAPVRTTT